MKKRAWISIGWPYIPCKDSVNSSVNKIQDKTWKELSRKALITCHPKIKGIKLIPYRMNM